MGHRWWRRKSPRRRRPVMTPVLGVVREQGGPAAPTPQYKGWPLRGELLMSFRLTDSQLVTVSTTITDKRGNPATVSGTPAWLVDNPNVLALAPAADGLSCQVSAVGPLGTAVVSMKADADLGAGVTEIAGILEVEVVSGAAVTVTLTPGAPAEQP